ncbi:MAG: 1-deoxy-D-xylulose-5-phosphate synthase [Bernardetiaceae bacterium]|nr:1-deoxy-D-xylulose-5-phosphate synthase [Bernardetiaceae bacterium]
MEELPQVAAALRTFLIQHAAEHGGHLGATLGVIELTIALHYTLNTPEDKLIWDVGHQAYAHKILTGRLQNFHQNRKKDGISGFPKLGESDFDVFGTGHSSTSLSAMLGLAVAAKIQGIERHHVAVIGDGGLTAGLAFEALHNMAASGVQMLIIINDNGMSIDPNVGGIAQHLKNLSEAKVKYNLFESLGIEYIDCIDGHDFEEILLTLHHCLHRPGVKVLHCVTEKGRGFAPAHQDKRKAHATTGFDYHNPDSFLEKSIRPLTFQDVFAQTMLELASENERILAVSPAMISGSGLSQMQKHYPERVFDVGIAEPHAVTFSAGLAVGGFLPYCHIYSTFLQRAYDQLIHDVCIQSLPLVLCVDRAGAVGADGTTHQGAYDLVYLRCLPNIIISAPLDEHELRNLLYTAQFTHDKVFAIRYPRASALQNRMPDAPFEKLAVGKGRKLKAGSRIAVLSLGFAGKLLSPALSQLSTGFQAEIAHYDMRYLKPLDKTLLSEVFQDYDKIMTLEDGVLEGGFGAAVLEYASEVGYKGATKCMGMADICLPQGSLSEQYEMGGYSPRDIAEALLAWLR